MTIVRKLLIIISIVILSNFSASSSDFSTLWKKVEEAQKKDLPRTQLSLLDEIIKLSKKEKAWGHLVKAQIKTIGIKSTISPDSLNSYIEYLNREIHTSDDKVLQAVYHSALGTIYTKKGDEVEAKKHYSQSLETPSLLAQTKIKKYNPAIVEGRDSHFFNDDLLHVLGYAAADYALIHNYYRQQNNKEAALLTGLDLIRQRKNVYENNYSNSKYVAALDSLMKEYDGIDAACEIDIAKYEIMKNSVDVSAQQKYEFLLEAIEKWKRWDNSATLYNELAELTNPQFDVDLGRQLILPTERRTIKIKNIRNIESISFVITRLDTNGDKSWDLYDKKDIATLKKLKQKSTEEIFQLSFSDENIQDKKHAKYELFNDSILLPFLPLGVYFVEVSTPTPSIGTVYMMFNVSNMFAICEEMPNKQIRYVAVDATEGQPIPNANLRITTSNGWNKDDNIEIVKTDTKGEYIYSYTQNRPHNVWVYTDSDTYLPQNYLSSHINIHRNQKTKTNIKIFTDRTIYRPGQTIKAALLAYSITQKNETTPVFDKNYTIVLRDANYQEVAKETIKTDSYGKASVNFVIPKEGLTGSYFLSVENHTNTIINVEEYKRPTFYVEFEDYNQTYNVGDTIKIKGMAKTYTGQPLSTATISYNVVRKSASWWFRNINDMGRELLIEGKAMTNDDGSFTIEVPMLLPSHSNDNHRHPQFYTIEANAIVTDMAGESHNSSVSLPIGTRPTAFTVLMKDKILQNTDEVVSFAYHNMAGKPIDARVELVINGQKIGTYSTNVDLNIKRISSLPSGKHHLKAVCENDTIEKDFIVFSLKDTKPVIETHDWYYLTSNVFDEEGNPIHLQIGSSDNNLHVVYNIFNDYEIIEKGHFSLNNSLLNREFVYKEDFKDVVYISFAWVKDATLYTHSALLRKSLPQKQLFAKWKSFRNRLHPGKQEEWILSIKDSNGNPVSAQTVAVLYDKSLDQIKKNNWSFSVNFNQTYINSRWNSYFFPNNGQFVAQSFNWTPTHQLEIGHFDYSILDFYQPYNRLYSGVRMKSLGLPVAARATLDVVQSETIDGVALSNSATEEGNLLKRDSVAPEELKEDNNTPNKFSLRENLQETAFFYSDLLTNEEGDVCIRFIMPEALTTWKFFSFSHDKEMNYCIVDAEAVAKKNIMVKPNMPRFLRQGDKATIKTNIVNTTESIQNGLVTLQLINPETEEICFQQSKTFQTEAEETISVGFEVNLPQDQIPLYICRVIADCQNFSDGEQHYIPILSNSEIVLKTHSFTQRTSGTYSFNLNNLFDVNSENQYLTLEYTNNPAWLMIQSLPTYSVSDKDDIISHATSLYVNTIGKSIMQSSPKIEETLTKWSTNNREMLESELATNEELHLANLTETPWVMKSLQMASQKRNLIKFFDKPTINQRIEKAIKVLKERQNADGSWSWWQGMQGSIYVTTIVNKLLARLQNIAEDSHQLNELLDKSYKFLDQYIYDEYAYIIKQKPENRKRFVPSEITLQILYAYSVVDYKPVSKAREAYDYFIKRLTGLNNSFSIYGKACSAVVLSKAGYKNKAKDCLNSMEEYSVYNEEMGRYYDSPLAHYSWCDYKIPTQVAAIEALKLLKSDEVSTISEMQQWLLQEKRTTSWDTPINAIEAVSAFLDKKAGMFDEQPLPQLYFDNKLLNDDLEFIPGTGYIKIATPRNDYQELYVTKLSSNTSWGAIYAQANQSLKDVTEHSNGLKIERVLLNSKGQIIDSTKSLKVGDLIRVRITIHAERDYDFVEVIDNRAACFEPHNQLSGYRHGCYVANRDKSTCYYFDMMPKGTHVIETEYFVDREGEYQSGAAVVQCAYSPSFMGRAKPIKIKVD